MPIPQGRGNTLSPPCSPTPTQKSSTSLQAEEFPKEELLLHLLWVCSKVIQRMQAQLTTNVTVLEDHQAVFQSSLSPLKKKKKEADSPCPISKWQDN